MEDMKEAFSATYKELNLDRGNNIVGGLGGGIFIGQDGVAEINGGRICNNYAAIAGGGIYTSGKLTTTNASIDHNTVSYHHGAGVFINHSTGEHNWHLYSKPKGELTAHEVVTHINNRLSNILNLGPSILRECLGNL